MLYRKDFAILSEPNTAYLDHAASSLTPDCVVQVMSEYYFQYRANVHRGVYPWSSRASSAYECGRDHIANFIGADADELVFTRGATEGINLVAQSYLAHQLKPGQCILISPLEHHANMIPWQRLAKEHGCQLLYIPTDDQYAIDWESLTLLISKHDIALVALTHASNVLGVQYDIAKIANYGIPVLVDGTQMLSHSPVNVKKLGCAFYVFSAHKMYGPTGIGGLYIDKAYHSQIKPHYTGGGIVQAVSYESATLQAGIRVLEPGTPPIAEVVGFARACQYIQDIGFEVIAQHEQKLMQQVHAVMQDQRMVTFGPKDHMVCSFEYPGVHPHDVATILGESGVMVRAGHHCCMPLMQSLGVSALTRLSVGVYNTSEDIKQFAQALADVRGIMQQ